MTETRKAGAGAAALGGCVGTSCAIWIGLAGLAMLFIFWPLGLALLVVAVIFPFALAGSMAAALIGECPYCGHAVTASAADQAAGRMDCTACKKRILIKDGQFRAIE